MMTGVLSDIRSLTAQLLERLFDASVDELRVVSQENRLYSGIYWIDARISGQVRLLVVKTWSSKTAYRAQMQAIDRARKAFEGWSSVAIPFLTCDAEHQVLIMERVEDPTIESLTRCEASLRGLDLVQWRRRLEQACAAAGQWLATWHSHERTRAGIDALLGVYVEDRPEQLALLDHHDQNRLLDLIGRLDCGVVSAVHGDFTPLNVLWSPQRLTVLDFGIEVWRHMSPAWDFCTMRIGIERELRFATRSPGRWLKRLRKAPLDAFDQGYGVGDLDRTTLDACFAVRHLNLYAADISRGPALARRAEWHRASLASILDAYR